ncbi:hypothetical protein QFZ79_003110 [Arthrobacter sp. V4I6]|uniref:hypothetical protein n=1 Tax=unclassified Arthrobacter TaxID=235627 RepID=UPI00278274B4|nr:MULTISPECIES: hypothetical protein [unclassified Arthrobacter]MDQ0854999.1 hypothetical protein [Arthrobacter sp. V4I6]
MGDFHQKADAGLETVRTSRRGSAESAPGREVATGTVLALQHAAGNRAVSGLIGSAPLQRQPSGPAANIPADRGDLERGFFSVTKKVTYGVRVAGPQRPDGLWFDHLFESRAEAEAYAKSVAAKGEGAIRDSAGLPRALPAKAPGGAPVPGNPVVNVYVVEVPAGTPTVAGAVRSQPESSAAPGLPKSYPGGGPQTVIAAGTKETVVSVFRVSGVVTPPSHQLPPAAVTSGASGAVATAESRSLLPVTLRSVLREAVESGLLRAMARNLVQGLIIGALVGLITAWAHRGILDQRLARLEAVIRDRLAEELPSGLEKALRHPTQTIFACIVRVSHPSGISLDLRGRGEGPPDARPEHVRVFFDMEPHDGELAQGNSGDWVHFETWTEYGKSLPLDTLLEQVSPQLRQSFTMEKQRAREVFYSEHPGQRPLSSVSSKPSEDPVTPSRQ